MDKKIDLENIMYNEDGSFRPLTASSGNVDGELAELRNIYMEAEREYFERLLANKDIWNTFVSYLDYSSDELFEAAMNIQNKLENGELETSHELDMMKSMTPGEKEEFHMRKLESAEGLICLLLAATRDKVKILELVRGYSSGRSR